MDLMNKRLLDEYKNIRKYIENDKDKAIKYDEDFISWFYNYKKETITKRAKILSNQLKRADTVEEQDIIKKRNI
jgi:hypothetical protein